MIKKVFKLLLFLACVGSLSLIGFYFSAKTYYTRQAKTKAENIIAQVSPEGNEAQELIDITSEIHRLFKPDEPSNYWQLRLRPYLTNTKLPSSIRFQDGVIETLIETGLCDNAARFLQFVLSQKGYASEQWNMITSNRAHSVLHVNLKNGDTVLLDPLFGIVGYDRKHKTLLSPFDIRQRMQDGAAFEDVFLKLDDKADMEFYEDFATVRMNAIGKPLEIDADLPIADDDGVFLGEIDGNDSDVYNAAAANGMSPFWHYAGHKYDRSWVRTLKIHQDVRLEFILVSDVEESVITSDKKPEVDGKIMRWDLKKGDSLTFYDGRAKRSWERMNSYINIDQITIYKK